MQRRGGAEEDESSEGSDDEDDEEESDGANHGTATVAEKEGGEDSSSSDEDESFASDDDHAIFDDRGLDGDVAAGFDLPPTTTTQKPMHKRKASSSSHNDNLAVTSNRSSKKSKTTASARKEPPPIESGSHRGSGAGKVNGRPRTRKAVDAKRLELLTDMSEGSSGSSKDEASSERKLSDEGGGGAGGYDGGLGENGQNDVEHQRTQRKHAPSDGDEDGFDGYKGRKSALASKEPPSLQPVATVKIWFKRGGDRLSRGACSRSTLAPLNWLRGARELPLLRQSADSSAHRHHDASSHPACAFGRSSAMATLQGIFYHAKGGSRGARCPRGPTSRAQRARSLWLSKQLDRQCAHQWQRSQGQQSYDETSQPQGQE